MISEIRKLGHKDCLVRLSEIVHTETDTTLVIQASNVLAPYIHSKRGTTPAPRIVEESIEVPTMQTIKITSAHRGQTVATNGTLTWAGSD